MKSWLFSKTNIILLGLSAALLVVGYVLLGMGPVENPLSKTVAPIILVAVYCGLIPLSIAYGYGKGHGGKTVKK